MRFLLVVLTVVAVWGLTLALPETDEQTRLSTMLGISAKGDPDAFRMVGDGTDSVIVSDSGELNAAGEPRSIVKPATSKDAKVLLDDAAPTKEIVLVKSEGPKKAVTPTGKKQPDLIATPAEAVADAATIGEKLDVARLDGTVVPGERRALTIKMQQQLRRVGCYSGKINGLWSAGSRAAMAKFNNHIAAELPIDQPDYVLLTLVEKYEDRACGVSCGTDRIPDARGVCVAKVQPAEAADEPVAVAEVSVPPKRKSKPSADQSAGDEAGTGETGLVVAATETEVVARPAKNVAPKVGRSVPKVAVDQEQQAGEPGNGITASEEVTDAVEQDILVSEPIEVARLEQPQVEAPSAATASAMDLADPAEPALAGDFAVVVPNGDTPKKPRRSKAEEKPSKLAVKRAADARKAEEEAIARSFEVAAVNIESNDEDLAEPATKRRRIVELSRALDEPEAINARKKARARVAFNAPRLGLGVRVFKLQRPKLRTARAERVVFVKRRFKTRFRGRGESWKVKVFEKDR